MPGLRLVDVKQGCLGIEWIEGWSVREILGGGQEDDLAAEAEGELEAEEDEDGVEHAGEALRAAGVDEGASFVFVVPAQVTLGADSPRC